MTPLVAAALFGATLAAGLGATIVFVAVDARDHAYAAYGVALLVIAAALLALAAASDPAAHLAPTGAADTGGAR